MSVLVIGTVRLPPEKFDEARPAMARMIAASLAEDGCIAYGYSEDVLEPGLMHVMEEWRDREILERTFQDAAPRRMAGRMEVARLARPQPSPL